MTDIINVSVSQAQPPIKVTVSDPNDEQIFVMVSDIVSGLPGGPNFPTVVFQGVINGATELTGTANTLTGFTEGSTLITLADFAGVRVEVNRGGQDSPSIGPWAVFTKDLSSDSILFFSPLEDGEYLKIKTIPA